jgi:hypothetical protein
MNPLVKNCLAVTVCVAFVAPAFADEAPPALSVGLTAGSLGLGPEVAYRFGSHFGLRANFAAFSYGTDHDYGAVRYAVDLKLSNGGVMADWYPLGGGFRISGGLRANGDELDLKGSPTASVQIGPTTYTPDQIGTLTGEISGAGTAPVLSLGYGGTLAKGGLTAGIEVGVMFQGAPRVKNLKATGQLAANQQFQADLVAEAKKIENDASSFKLWPILQLQLVYRF